MANPSAHNESRRILDRFGREGISSLYHFTCVDNLAAIREAGALCSKQALEEADQWPVPQPGGNDLSHSLDKYCGNWDKVALNFTPHTPMAYRKKPEKHLCFFLVGAEVATAPGVVFTDRNATATAGQRRGCGLPGLDLVDFRAIRAAPRPWDKQGWVTPVQAEVLVPDRIALEKVEAVCFVSKASQLEGELVWGSSAHPPFKVDPRVFADITRGRKWAVQFSYVEVCILTDQRVSNQNYETTFRHTTCFRRSQHDRITLVATVMPVGGTKIEVEWCEDGPTSTEEFATAGRWCYWPHAPLDRLPDGDCCVRVYLDEVRRASRTYTIVRD